MRIVQKHNLTKYDDLTGIKKTKYTPGYREKNTKKLENRKIIDITAQNKSQVPAYRNGKKVLFIVIHYLGVPNADNPNLYGGGYGGHFNVERNGSIYKAADPKTAVVWHCGGGLQGSGGHTYHGICTNSNSIGIECGVCYDGTEKNPSAESDKWYFTEETQESLVWLVSKLMDEFDICIDHVIRHYDVTGKICPNPYVKNNRLKTSWTWDRFKANLAQYRKDGTIQTGEAPEDSKKEYVVQCGVFSVKENAENLVKRLKAAGFDAIIK
jgi:N-acetylmuramoyl-L-alanine amidase CwlA